MPSTTTLYRGLPIKKTIFLFLVAFVAILSVMSLSPPQTTMAASSCYRTSCNGKNPNLYTCASDARTVSSKFFAQQLGILELRYSPRCDVHWSRVTTYGLQNPNSYVALTVNVPNQAVYTNAGGSGNTVWSKMMYSNGRTVKACGTYPNPYLYISLLTKVEANMSNC